MVAEHFDRVDLEGEERRWECNSDLDWVGYFLGSCVVDWKQIEVVNVPEIVDWCH